MVLTSDPARPVAVTLHSGDLIRKARLDAGLSARALSIKAGCSESYVSKMESGEISPSVKMIAKIARVLQLRPHEVWLIVMVEG